MHWNHAKHHVLINFMHNRRENDGMCTSQTHTGVVPLDDQPPPKLEPLTASPRACTTFWMTAEAQPAMSTLQPISQQPTARNQHRGVNTTQRGRQTHTL